MKYKLKKWYPSLNPRLKEGTIFKETKKNKIRGEDRSYVYDGEICPYFVSAHEVENNPEFWEHVEEKNYEILSIKWGDTEQIIKFKDNHKYTDHEWGGKWNIYSVKRLSDGEVFTVGDKIKLNDQRSYCGKIESFCHHSDYTNNLRIIFDTGIEFINSSFDNNIKHVKPLFTTEEYIDQHKPRYSKADIEKALDNAKLIKLDSCYAYIDLYTFENELNL